MTKPHYVIVGAEVDAAHSFLKDDGTITGDPKGKAQPLDVEFIGQLITRLSQQGPAATSEADRKRHAEQVRRSLQVVALQGTTLTAAQEQAILDKVEVRIEFESRTTTVDGDHNLRILVVPSDDTLQIKMDQLAQLKKEKGFPPPLSYELDRALMTASVAHEMRQIVVGFAAKNVADWTQALQDALEAHVNEALDALTMFRDPNGAPAESVKNAILNDPVRSFHRSVGIYATNMCR